MNYKYFIVYNVVGALAWVFICTLLGYFFGNIPIIKENFSTVLLLIIFISVLPAIISAINAHRKKISEVMNMTKMNVESFNLITQR